MIQNLLPVIIEMLLDTWHLLMFEMSWVLFYFPAAFQALL